MTDRSAQPWPKRLGAITLFVADLPASKAFYSHVFELPIMFEDTSSVVFDFGNTIINLLDLRNAPELVEPEPVAVAGTGARAQLTVDVDDVDAVCVRLAERGVELLNGPMDRPWGVRTAAFRDPSGHVWEVAK